MMTIRLQDMTDDEYKRVTECKCPGCGGRGHARTSYGNITSTGRCVDVVCDSCGAAWSIYASGDETWEQQQIPLLEVDPSENVCPSAEDVALDELQHLSDNKLRHMKKNELISLALDLDEDDIACLSKPEMIEALISIRDVRR